MPTTRLHWVLWLLTFFLAPSISQAATRLTPVVRGLTNPVFVTSAKDGTKRLFIVEQEGTIRVLQNGGSTTTLFLDIRARVLAGGERGLLGLAFHPLYRSNRRFFVYYTRVPDGAIVVAEYAASDDRDAAVASETELLTIPHPFFANHNGGMLVFGPGGYLFIGVGDGGSANDPSNNAQNRDTLLGKILRINVDTPDHAAGTPYSSPSGNPFVNAPGRDEIYALGLRNPWRFSFDRRFDTLWVADVGQDAREEVDAPVFAGRNYGWRVYEGSACTNNDPVLCGNAYTAPRFDYTHDGGRCSITGGYVYRGSRGAIAGAPYVFADYCTGEIFTWDGRQQRLLLRADGNVSSFGEDEDGEIYVVTLDGLLAKLTKQ